MKEHILTCWKCNVSKQTDSSVQLRTIGGDWIGCDTCAEKDLEKMKAESTPEQLEKLEKYLASE